uniref:Uncharacterized protein n=1 Tax=Cacopsylla melanoneura TaxID=428564 RepID=A0A8D8VSQ6_9HEMI
MHPNVFCCLPIVTAILMGSAAAFVSSQSDKVPMLHVSTDSSTNASAVPKVTPDVIGVFLQVQEVLLRLVETLQGVVTHLMSGLTGGDPSSTTIRLDDDPLDGDISNSSARSNNSNLDRNSSTYKTSDVLTPNVSGLHSSGNGYDIALERRDDEDIAPGDAFSKNKKKKPPNNRAPPPPKKGGHAGGPGLQ